MKKIVKLILGVPKILYYNFRIFDFKTALHFPLIVAHKAVIYNPKRGSIKISGNPSFGMLTVGLWDGSDHLGIGQYTTIEFNDSSTISIDGHVSIASGSHLYIGKSAKLQIGSGFKGNYGLHIVCRKHITIGTDVLISWNCSIMDSDGHEIINKENELVNKNEEIIIGDHVWIGSTVTILKGTSIANGSIIGSNCTVHKKCLENNSIYVSSETVRRLPREEMNWIL